MCKWVKFSASGEQAARGTCLGPPRKRLGCSSEFEHWGLVTDLKLALADFLVFGQLLS